MFRNVLTTYEYEIIMDHTPSISHMLLITGTDKKQSKVILATNQVLSHRQNVEIKTIFDTSGRNSDLTSSHQVEKTDLMPQTR
jgi:hypothetical protein